MKNDSAFKPLVGPPDEPADPVRIVTGIRLRAIWSHEHDGHLYRSGEEFVAESASASLLLRRGLVEYICKEEEIAP